MIGKMKFFHTNNQTVCEIRGKYGTGIGVATLKEKNTPSKLMGEMIAVYKAERSLIKDNIRKQKERIKFLEDFYVYLFPAKFHGRQIDWIKDRFAVYFNKENKKLIKWEEELVEVEKALASYLHDREASLKKIENYRNRVAARNVDSVSTENQK